MLFTLSFLEGWVSPEREPSTRQSKSEKKTMLCTLSPSQTKIATVGGICFCLFFFLFLVLVFGLGWAGLAFMIPHLC